MKTRSLLIYSCMLLCFVAIGYFGKNLIMPNPTHNSSPAFAAVGDFCDYDAVNGPSGSTPCPSGEWCDFSQGSGPENGQCILACGNGLCDNGEDNASCSIDCAPPALCPNGTCDVAQGETYGNCPNDCPSTCGDSTCDSWENANSCYTDCGVCGDGNCSIPEGAGGANECLTDCTCGDGICDGGIGEDYLTCLTDCDTCGVDGDGDGDLCDSGETVTTSSGVTILCGDCVVDGDGICSFEFNEHLQSPASSDCPCDLNGVCSEAEWDAGNMGVNMNNSDTNSHWCNDCSTFTCDNDGVCENNGGDSIENCSCADCGDTIRNPGSPVSSQVTCNEAYPPEDACDISESTCPGGNCPGDSVPSDVFLVIDTSSSMLEGNKADGVKRLMRSVLNSLPTGSRASLITFDNTGDIVHQLTTDIAAVKSSVNTFDFFIPATGALTNYVDAYDYLGDEVLLRQGTFAGRNQLVLFLSDGEPTLGSTDPSCQTNAHVNDPLDTCQFDAAKTAATDFKITFPDVEVQALGMDAISSPYPTETVDILENFVSTSPAHYTEIDSNSPYTYVPGSNPAQYVYDENYCSTTNDFDVYNSTFCGEVCEPVDGTCGGANGNTYAWDDTDYAPDAQCDQGNGVASDTSFPSPGGTVTWTCGGGAGGVDSPTCTASTDPMPVCGTANTTYPNGTAGYGADTFCATGTPTPVTPAFPTAGNTVSWTCASPNGGTSVSCQASQIGTIPEDGICGGANGVTYAYNITAYFPDVQCAAGNSTNTAFPSQGGTESWTCLGVNGGVDANCSASRDVAPDAPVCGTANMVYPNGTTGYGTDTFCEVGTPTPTTPAFPSAGNSVSWICSNGGLDTDCSASQAGTTPIAGECGTIITPGTYYGQNLYPAPTDEFCVGGVTQVSAFQGPDSDGGYTWNCAGFNGGIQVACSIDENRCGDGTPQSGNGEQCDDGNTTNGDGCSSTCTYEQPVCTGFSVSPENGPEGTVATAMIPMNQGFAFVNLDRGDGSAVVANPALTENNTYGTAGNYTIEVVVTNTLPGSGTFVTDVTCTESIEIDASPEDGVCGSAAITYPNGATGFTGTFCEEGDMAPSSVIFPTAGNSVSWNCLGTNGGASPLCVATQASLTPEDGTCGGANGNTYPVGVTSYGADQQCATGNSTNTAFPASGTTETWTCSSVNGGSTSVPCSASSQAPIPVQGVCGTINGNTYYGENVFTSPNATFCDGGVTNVVNFQGPDASGTYTWTCAGANGGAQSAECSIDENRCGDANDDGTSVFENGTAMEQCDDGNSIETDACTTACTDVIVTPPPAGTYDLALVKTLSGTVTEFSEGESVTFDLEVINQGTLPASGITLTDYIPEGLTLADTAWTQVGTRATYTYVGTLQAGMRDTVSITFTITDDNRTIRNRGEISSDDGDDRDSTPDDTNTDCYYESGTMSSDNYELGMGSTILCNSINGDEDDHDWAEIVVVANPVVITGGGASSSISPENLIIPPKPEPQGTVVTIPDPEPVVVQPIVVEPAPQPETPEPVDPLMYTYVEDIKIERTTGVGDHYFEGTPQYLQTGMTVEQGMVEYGIGVRKDYRVTTDAPTWGKAHDGETYPKDLNYWLQNVLLPHDANAGNAEMYVLLPEAGYLLPINELSPEDETYGKMVRGEDVDVAQELQDDFETGIVHHAGSVRPGQFGRAVTAMHSSWWKDSGKYTEGKYPTVGQILATLLPGDEVVYYVKNPTGGYDHHVYMVNAIKEVNPSDINDIYPAKGYEAMLYTCTDFGVSDQRLLATMQYVSGDRGLVDFSITDYQRELIDGMFSNLHGKHENAEVITKVLTKVWNKIKSMEENGQVSLFVREPIRYIKWHISNTLKSLENDSFDVFG